MLEYGQKVIFYYDSTLPYVEGIIQDYTVSEINALSDPIKLRKIHWCTGGCSFVPAEHIFTTKEAWKEFMEQKGEDYRLQYIILNAVHKNGFLPMNESFSTL